MKIKNCFLVIVVMLAFFSQANATNLILNGSFEFATVNPGNSFVTLGTGDTRITHWTVTNGSIDYIGGYWQASDGSRSIDLSGNQAGELEVSQPFNTIVGQQYLLTFDMAGNPDRQGIKTMQVTVAGQSQDYAFDSTGKTKTNMGWMSQSFLFTATNINTTLKFTSLTTNAWGPALDNVSVTVIPEPGTFLLLGSGLLGIGISARIRRKKSYFNS